MNRLLVPAIAMAMLVSLLAPGFAYEFNWFDGFESGTVSNWTVQAGSFTAEMPPNPVYQGGYAARQGVNTVSPYADRMAKDFRPYTGANNWTFYQGQVEAWVYDDLTFGTGSIDDLRMAASSKGGTTGSNIVAAVCNTSTGWGSQQYYSFQTSYTQGPLDGVYLPSVAGLTFTLGPSAPRSIGWHRWRVTWSFDYVAQTGTIRWYVDSTLTPKLTMGVSSASGRWPSLNNVAYAVLGEWSNTNSGANWLDNVWFRGDAVPEPGSLLALGTGLLGLGGLIRRKR